MDWFDALLLIISIVIATLLFVYALLRIKIQNKQKDYYNQITQKTIRLQSNYTTPITKKSELPDDYVVLDFETTGLDPAVDNIIEVALVKVIGREPAYHYTTLINPNIVISPATEALTGITRNMLINQPPIDTVIYEILGFIGDSVIMGHNVDFDIKFLAANSPVQISNKTIDTLSYLRRWIKGLHSYKLRDIANFLNVDNPNHHRALNDCLVAQQCFEILRGRNENKDDIIYVDD